MASPNALDALAELQNAEIAAKVDEVQGANHLSISEVWEKCGEWFLFRLSTAFGVSVEQMEQLMAQDDNLAFAASFFADGSKRRLFVCMDSSGIVTLHSKLPAQPPEKMLYFLRSQTIATASSTDDINLDDFICGDVPVGVLDHLSLLSNEVLYPVFSNTVSQETMSEGTHRELTQHLHKFLSQAYIMVGLTRGRTLLPLPPRDVLPGGSSGHSERAVMKDKDRVHILENSVVMWTRQIKAVVKQESSTETLGEIGILEEIEFWKNRAQNLSSLFDQLQGDRVKKVLKVLEASKSSYFTAFVRLCKDVSVNKDEAIDLYRYLRPLRRVFRRCFDGVTLHSILQTFPPIFHCLLLAWGQSKHFQQQHRLQNLLERIGNDVISVCRKYLKGQDVLKLPREDVRWVLRRSVVVCAGLRSAYFDFKQQSEAMYGEKLMWAAQEFVVFGRIDIFIERCHDLLDLLDTIDDFDVLNGVVVGGPRGRKLTRLVRQIDTEFQFSANQVANIEYDALDVSVKEFDDDFYAFRTSARNLERRLSAIVSEGLDADPSLRGACALLSVFGPLLKRKIMTAQLSVLMARLVSNSQDELAVVQDLFLKQKDSPPVHDNMPPIAGALVWANGLKERATYAPTQFKLLMPDLMQGEDALPLLGGTTAFAISVDEYMSGLLDGLGEGVGEAISQMLKSPLLSRSSDGGNLAVNVDPNVLASIREAQYLKALNFAIPAELDGLLAKSASLSLHLSHIELIVRQYNDMRTSLDEVEASLMEGKLSHLDVALEEGISTLTWKSHAISAFLKRATALVRESVAVVRTLKESVKSIEEILGKWSLSSLFDHGFRRTLPASEYLESFKGSLAARMHEIREEGLRIHTHLQNIHSTLQVSRGEPAWRQFVLHLSSKVVDILREATVASLASVSNMIDPSYISVHSLPPIIESRLELAAPDVLFDPPLSKSPHGEGLADIVESWIKASLTVPASLKRLDAPQGDYSEEVCQDVSVASSVASVRTLTEEVFGQCNDIRDTYIEFRHLWAEDPSAGFAEFLEHLRGQDLSEEEELSMFSGKLGGLRKQEDSVKALPNNVIVAWLRIDGKPIKQALYTWLSKWSFAYSDHLLTMLFSQVESLQETVQCVLNDLSAVSEGKLDIPLDDIMGHIVNVRTTDTETRNLLRQLSSVHSTLQSHAVDIPQWISKSLHTLPDSWSRALELAISCEKLLSDVIDHQRLKIQERVEKFQEAVQVFRDHYVTSMPFSFDGSPDSAYRSLDSIMSASDQPLEMEVVAKPKMQLPDVEIEAAGLATIEKLYNMPITEYQDLVRCRSDARSLKTVWDLVALSHSELDKVLDEPWNTVDLSSCCESNQELQQMFCALPADAQDWDVTKGSLASLQAQRQSMDIMNQIRAAPIKDRHWKAIVRMVSSAADSDKTMSLREMLSLDIHRHSDSIREILHKAACESGIEATLRSLTEIWADQSLDFDIQSGINNEDVVDALPTLSKPPSLGELLDDSLARLQVLHADPHVVNNQPFLEDVQRWQKKLTSVEIVMEVWLNVQTGLQTLQSLLDPVNSLAAEVPEVASELRVVAQRWWRLMTAAAQRPLTLDACNEEGRLAVLQGLLGSIEKCSSALQGQLLVACQSTPRLLMLPSQDISSLLGASRDPKRINALIRAVLPGVDRIIWQGEQVHERAASSAPPEVRSQSRASLVSDARTYATPGGRESGALRRAKESSLSNATDTVEEQNFTEAIAVAVQGRLGEKLLLAEPVDCRRAATDWIPDLLAAVQRALRSQLVPCLKACMEASAGDCWFEETTGQIACLVARVEHTNAIREALLRVESGDSDALKLAMDSLESELAARALMLQQDTMRPAKGAEGSRPVGVGLTDAERRKIASTILVTVGWREVSSSLQTAGVDGGVANVKDFAWACAPRVSLSGEERNDVCIHFVSRDSAYGWEYQGEDLRINVPSLETVSAVLSLVRTHMHFTAGLLFGSVGSGRGSVCSELSSSLGSFIVEADVNQIRNAAVLSRLVVAAAANGALFVVHGLGSMCGSSDPSIRAAMISMAQAIESVLHALRSGRKQDSLIVGSSTFDVNINTGICLVGQKADMPTYHSHLPMSLARSIRPIAVIPASAEVVCRALLLCDGFRHASQLGKILASLLAMAPPMIAASSKASDSSRVPLQWHLGVAKSIISCAALLLHARGYLDPVVDTQPSPLESAQDYDGSAHGEEEDDNIFRDGVLNPHSEVGREMRLLQQACLDAVVPQLDAFESMSYTAVVQSAFDPLPLPATAAAVSRPVSRHSGSRPVSAVGLAPKPTDARHTFLTNESADQPVHNDLHSRPSASGYARGSVPAKPHVDMAQKPIGAVSSMWEMSEWADFADAFVQACKQTNSSPTEDMIIKAAQLNAGLALRSGIAILGSAGCGKSTLWKTLSVTKCSGVPAVQASVVFPKALARHVFHGTAENAHEGLFASLLSNATSVSNDDTGSGSREKWIVLDGNIDPIWSDVLSPVFAGPSSYILPTQGRVPMRSSARVIFESSDLSNASPALASSIGIVCLSETDLSWQGHVRHWLDSCQGSSQAAQAMQQDSASISSRLNSAAGSVGGALIGSTASAVRQKEVFPVEAGFVMETMLSSSSGVLAASLDQAIRLCSECSMPLGTSPSSWKIAATASVLVVIEQWYSHYERLLPTSTPLHMGAGPVNHAPEATVAECVNSFAIICGVGHILREPVRQRWAEWARNCLPGLDIGQHSVFDVFYGRGGWADWGDAVPQSVFVHASGRTDAGNSAADFPPGSLLVPSAQSISAQHIIDLWKAGGRPVVVSGNSGIGKTALLRDRLAQADPETCIGTVYVMHSFSNAWQLQDALESTLERKSGRLLAPPGQKNLQLLIDDMSAPDADQYCSRSAIELIRQLCDGKVLLDREGYQTKSVQNVYFIGTCRHRPSSPALDFRMLRHFSTFEYANPSQETLSSIFGSIVEGAVSKLSSSVRGLGVQIVNATLEIVADLRDTLKGGGATSAMQFDGHSVSRILDGLFRLEPSEVLYPESLLRAWSHNVLREFSDPLPAADDRLLLEEILVRRIKSNFDTFDPNSILQHNIVLAQPIKAAKKGPSAIQAMAQRADTAPKQGGGWKKVSSMMPSRKIPGIVNVVVNALSKGSDGAADHQTKLFSELPMPSLQRLAEQAVEAAMRDSAKSSIPIIASDVAVHAARVAFTLSRHVDSGILLVGDRGSGRSVAVRVGAQMASQKVVVLPSDPRSALETVKSCILRAGIEGERLVVQSSASHFMDSTIAPFLGAVNRGCGAAQLLSLFSRSEREDIISKARPQVRKLGLVDSIDHCAAFFARQIGAGVRLAAVLTRSELIECRASMLSTFPFLAIDVMPNWTSDCLIDLASRILTGIPDATPETIDMVSSHLALVHTTAQAQCAAGSEQVPSCRFIWIVEALRNFFLERHAYLTKCLGALNGSLSTLKRVHSGMKELDTQMLKQDTSLEQKSEHAQSLLSQVGQETALLESHRQGLAKEEQHLASLQANKQEIQAEVDVANKDSAPLQDAVRSSSAALDKEAVAELRSMPVPSESVIHVVQAVGILVASRLRGVQVPSEPNASWTLVKRVLGQADKLLQAIQHLNVSHVQLAVIEKVESMFLTKENFKPETVASTSTTASRMCSWTTAFVGYWRAMEACKPKMVQLTKLNSQIDNALQKRTDAQAKVEAATERLANLTSAFETATEEKNAASTAANRAKQQAIVGKRLMHALEDDHSRWDRAAKNSLHMLGSALGDTTLAISYVCQGSTADNNALGIALYKGLLDLQGRGVELSVADATETSPISPSPEPASPIQSATPASLVPPSSAGGNGTSVNITGTSDSDVGRQLIDRVMSISISAQMACSWNANGLIQDASVRLPVALSRHFSKWPLFLDRSRQIRDCLSKCLKLEDDLVHLSASDPKASKIMGMACSSGKAVILEVSLHTPFPDGLYDVLRKSYKRTQRGEAVSIDGRLFDLDNSFRLLMVAADNAVPRTLQHMEYCLMPFSVNPSPASIKSQFIDSLFSRNAPELAPVFAKLMLSSAVHVSNAEAADETLLDLLATSEGEILERNDIVQSVEEAKAHLSTARHGVEESIRSQEQLSDSLSALNPLFNAFETASVLVYDLALRCSSPRMNCGSATIVQCVKQTTKRFVTSIPASLNSTEPSISADDASALTSLCKEAAESVLADLVTQLCAGLPTVDAAHVILHCIVVHSLNPSERVSQEQAMLAREVLSRFYVSGSLARLDLTCSAEGGGNSASSLLSPLRNRISKPKWLNSFQWNSLSALGTTCSTALASLSASPELIQQWFRSSNPEIAQLPDEVGSLNPLEKSLLILALRPDRLRSALHLVAPFSLSEAAAESLGRTSLEFLSWAVAQHDESEGFTPLVLSGSPNSVHSCREAVLKLAESKSLPVVTRAMCESANGVGTPGGAPIVQEFLRLASAPGVLLVDVLDSESSQGEWIGATVAALNDHAVGRTVVPPYNKLQAALSMSEGVPSSQGGPRSRQRGSLVAFEHWQSSELESLAGAWQLWTEAGSKVNPDFKLVCIARNPSDVPRHLLMNSILINCCEPWDVLSRQAALSNFVTSSVTDALNNLRETSQTVTDQDEQLPAEQQTQPVGGMVLALAITHAACIYGMKASPYLWKHSLVIGRDKLSCAIQEGSKIGVFEDGLSPSLFTSVCNHWLFDGCTTDLVSKRLLCLTASVMGGQDYGDAVRTAPHIRMPPPSLDGRDAIKDYVQDAFIPDAQAHGMPIPLGLAGESEDSFPVGPNNAVKLSAAGIADKAKATLDDIFEILPDNIPMDETSAAMSALSAVKRSNVDLLILDAKAGAGDNEDDEDDIGMDAMAAAAGAQLQRAQTNGQDPSGSPHTPKVSPDKNSSKEQLWRCIHFSEVRLVNCLLNLVRKTLSEVDAAVQGRLGWAGVEVNSAIRTIGTGCVPDEWSKLSPPSQDHLGSWIQSLIRRVEHLKQWTESHVLIPSVLDLASMFAPRAIYAAVSLEGVKPVVCEVLKRSADDVEGAPRNGVYVCGISIVGASWNAQAGQLEDSTPDSPELSQLPLVWLKTESDGNNVGQEVSGFQSPSPTAPWALGSYDCPVYSTRARTDVLFTLNLKSYKSSSRWGMAAVFAVLENSSDMADDESSN